MLLHSSHKARCPAAWALPVQAAPSTSAPLPAHRPRRQSPRTKTRILGDESWCPPQIDLRGFYARTPPTTTSIRKARLAYEKRSQCFQSGDFLHTFISELGYSPQARLGSSPLSYIFLHRACSFFHG